MMPSNSGHAVNDLQYQLEKGANGIMKISTVYYIIINNVMNQLPLVHIVLKNPVIIIIKVNNLYHKRL